MTTLTVGGTCIQQDPVQSINDDVYSKVYDLIIARTGQKPSRYWHLYEFKKHMDKFVHPNPLPCRQYMVRPLGLGEDRILELLQGWDEIEDIEIDNLLNTFNHPSRDDLQLAYDRFILQQGRPPRVREFEKYILALEGNKSRDISRKTLGNLLLETEQQKVNLQQNDQCIESLREIFASKDIMNNKLSEAYFAHLTEIHDLKTDKLHLQQILTAVQAERTQLQEERNVAQMDLDFLQQQNDDLRGEKIRLDFNCNELSKKNEDKSRLEETLTSVTETLTSVIEDKSRLEETLTSVTEDKSRLEETLTSVTEDKSRLEETLTSVTEDKSRLEETLTSVTEDKSRLEEDNRRLKETLEQNNTYIQRQLIIFKSMAIFFFLSLVLIAIFHSGMKLNLHHSSLHYD